MTTPPINPDPNMLIDLRLKELIQLILPLHALLEGSCDETTGRLKEVIDALAQIALALQKTVKSLNEDQRQLSPALDLRMNAITQTQDLQLQMLTDLHAWLGVPPRQTAEPRS